MTPPIVPGKNGMSTVLLSHPSGSSADVYLNGAHVTSWIPAGGREVLFMGKTATFAPGDPIRGGIPVVWPQFANIGPLPQHGFARKSEWELAENEGSSDDPASVKLVLKDDHRTREQWPYHFRTELTVTIDDKSLEVKLAAFNTGDELFSFTSALHTYIAVADIRETTIRGFTLQNGRGTLTSACGFQNAHLGGAILLLSGGLSVVDCIFKDNASDEVTNIVGGEHDWRPYLYSLYIQNRTREYVMWHPVSTGAGKIAGATTAAK